jgi:hypothetical protein
VREIELLNRLLDDRDATIRDLRARLDAEPEERRRVQAQLTGLLNRSDDRTGKPLLHQMLRWLAKQHV